MLLGKVITLGEFMIHVKKPNLKQQLEGSYKKENLCISVIEKRHNYH